MKTIGPTVTSPKLIDLEDSETFGRTTGLEVGYKVSVRVDDTRHIGLEALDHVEVDLQQGRQGDSRCGL